MRIIGRSGVEKVMRIIGRSGIEKVMRVTGRSGIDKVMRINRRTERTGKDRYFSHPAILHPRGHIVCKEASIVSRGEPRLTMKRIVCWRRYF
jgi:hypothetical protein